MSYLYELSSKDRHETNHRANFDMNFILFMFWEEEFMKGLPVTNFYEILGQFGQFVDGVESRGP